MKREEEEEEEEEYRQPASSQNTLLVQVYWKPKAKESKAFSIPFVGGPYHPPLWRCHSIEANASTIIFSWVVFEFLYEWGPWPRKRFGLVVVIVVGLVFGLVVVVLVVLVVLVVVVVVVVAVAAVAVLVLVHAML